MEPYTETEFIDALEFEAGHNLELATKLFSKRIIKLSMNTSRVKDVVVGNTYTGKYGEMINHTYTMEDGIVLQASHKKANPISVGEEVEYEITRIDEKYGNSGKVSKPKPAYSGGGKNNFSQVGVTVGNAINNAALLAAHGQIKVEEMRKYVEGFINTAIDMQAKYKDKF